MSGYVKVFFLLALMPKISKAKSFEIDFLVEYMKLDEKPKMLTSFLCWKSNHKIQLMKSMSKQNLRLLMIDLGRFLDLDIDLDMIRPEPDISQYVHINTFAEQTMSYPEKPQKSSTYNRNLLEVFWKQNHKNSNDLDSIPEVLPLEYNFYILDSTCEGFENVLKIANKDNKFSAPYTWLILTNDFQAIQNSLQLLDIFPDSNVVISENSGSANQEFIIWDLYKIDRKDNLRTKIINQWSSKGFRTKAKRILSLERRNLQGNPIPVVFYTSDNRTLGHLIDFKEPQIDAVTKMSFYVNYLQVQYANGTGAFFLASTYGYRAPNSSKYDGVIGEIQAKRAELGGCMFLLKERFEVLDYYTLYLSTRVEFIFRKPPLSYVTNIFTLPFSRTIWICTVALMFLISFMIFISVKHERKRNSQSQETGMEASFLEAAMLTVGALCTQGSNREPKSVSGRTAMFFGFIALMFLYVSYSANIIILLQSSADSIKTVEDLLNSRMELGCEDTIYNRHYFPIQTEPIRKAIYEKKIKKKNGQDSFSDIYEGVEKMRKDFYAFHTQKGSAYKIISDTFYEKEKCGLYSIDYLNMIYPWYVGKKNSSYKEIFRVGLRKIEEYGLNSMAMHRIYTKKPECHTRGSNFASVGIADVYGAFLSLLSGIVISIFLLIIEIIIYTCNKNK